MGRFVHGSVLIVVGQDSMPISTAIRSFWQNPSSCSRRRAIASNVPSSKKAPFRLVMVCPPKNRVGDALTGRFVPALAEERMSMTPRALNSIQQNRPFLDWLRTTDRKLVEIIYRTGRLRYADRFPPADAGATANLKLTFPLNHAAGNDEGCGCLKTFLSCPTGGLPPSWMTRCRRETPTTTMTKKTTRTQRTRKGTMSRHSSGNPNPTNSSAAALGSLPQGPMDYSDGTGRIEVAEQCCAGRVSSAQNPL